METVVVLGILSLILVAVGTFSVNVLRYNKILSDQLDAESQSRRVVAQFARDLRTAAPSSLGAYPLDIATATTLTFYANVDTDSLIERVRYFLNGANLQRGVLKPSGSPLTYNAANEQVATLLQNVRNTDIFSYYDQSYDGTTASLTFPVTLSAVRLAHFKVLIDASASAPPGSLDVETSVGVRNLKSN